MDKRLSGKVAIVVGAGSIGAEISNGMACAVTFARHGASVMCVDKSLAAAQVAVERIRALSGAADATGLAAPELAAPELAAPELAAAFAFEADVRDGARIKAMVQTCLERFGRIDILHHNVGIEAFGELTEQTEASWDGVHEVNLRGPMLTAREVVPHMIAQGGGSIINISSIASLRWSPQQYLSYSTSKAALNHMTRVIARQYARHQVRCNVILPGLIDTPHAGALYDTAEAAARGAESRARRCPMGRQGTPWDIANAALFLASDESAYVTGIELVVDGGVTL